jgi:phosphatidylinositol-3-phosphatase
MLALFAVSTGCSGADSSTETGGPRYAALEHAPTTSPEESGAARAGHAIKTIFIIMMENHDWADIKTSASAPFINGTLLPAGAHAENYFNPPGNHPSEPNYIWLEAGDNLAIADDLPPATNHRTTTKHLTSLLDDAGVSWKSYQEGIDGAGCPLTAAGLYDPKHDPMVYFDDITDGGSLTSQRCIAHVRPYPELAGDLKNDSVAAYNFITPNLCDDMHNNSGCPNADAIKNGDDWLAAEVPAILRSAAYQRGGALFITWDESEVGDSPIGMIILSPFAKAGYASPVHYTHSAMLRSAQEILAVQPFLRDAADAPNLGDLFTTYP